MSPPPLPHRPRTLFTVALIVASALGLLLLVLGSAAIVFALARPDLARRALPPLNAGSWTHAELIAHLRSRGLAFTEEQPATTLFGPSLHLVFADYEEPIVLNGVRTSHMVPARVRVLLVKNEQDARERAGVGGKRALAWHRFVFEGEPEPIAAIHAALK